MKITIRPMTIDEAWNLLMNNHSMYHKKLKHYKYGYSAFIPLTDDFIEMFEKENLTQQDIEHYKNIFATKIYDVKKLQRLDNTVENQVKPEFEQVVNKYLVPLIPSWNAIMPKELQIWCSFGCGSNYLRKSDDLAVMPFRMSRYPDDPTKILNVMFHEFVHMLIQKPIIQKYDVPQDLKERIVDLICYEFIKKPVQPMFEKSFANAYITSDAIKKDLPGAVAKMMTDYSAIKLTKQSGISK